MSGGSALLGAHDNKYNSTSTANTALSAPHTTPHTRHRTRVTYAAQSRHHGTHDGTANSSNGSGAKTT